MTQPFGGANALGYRVLARKYRPQTFADLIGQEAMVRTLTNAFKTGRIAQAYMLTGVRGVGKTTTARLIARALNYPGGPSIDMPEMTQTCETILESRHLDVIELDAASNTGVDNMREIIDNVRYAPVSAAYKVYIIDEVHMLSKSAFNALLKTLEEPPPHVKFIFATTEIRKVPVTILSRCQRFDLRRLDAAELMRHYAGIASREGVEADEEALRAIARAAEGSVRDGLSMLDQAIAFGAGKVRAEDVVQMLGLADRGRVIGLFEAVMSGGGAAMLQDAGDQFAQGADPATLLTDLADFVHWVTRLKVVGDAAVADASRTEVEKAKGKELAAKISMSQLTRAWQMLLKGLGEVNASDQPHTAAEMLLIRLAYASSLPSGEELVKLAKQAPAAEPPRSSPSANVQSLRRDQEPAAAAVAAVAPQRLPPPEAGAAPTAVTNFAQVVGLAGEKRDIKLKSEMERHVRPIRVQPGQIELALEAGAPPGLPGEMARKLEAWTGQRWIISVSKDGGETPLALQRKSARESAFRAVKEHPDVMAVFKRFPNAEIVDVRDAQPAAIEEESDEEYR
ncbi:MAG: DNA polymerase III subunit gamma/tau [Rhizobiales bacterium]|nr:DNA polymerase III subunit gamma/tau [Hyphomicrobiales bacterium]